MPSSRRNPGPLRKPLTVSIGELAIAAGMTGQSIAICFDDYPASTLCALWRDLTRGLDAETVLQVAGRAELKKLDDRLDRLRLVIVRNPRAYIEANWTINMKAKAQGAPVPSVFAGFAPADPDGDPAAALILSGSSNESTSLIPYLMQAQRPYVDWDRVGEWSAFHLTDSGIDLSFEDSLDLRKCIGPLRDLHLVRGLTTGACLLRAMQDSEPPARTINATVEDYERVRTLLVSRVINAADRPIDELALAMVNRANVYLEVKAGAERSGSAPDVDDGPRHSLAEPITRREMADLGNPKSRVVRRVIDHLKGMPDGHRHFSRMGLVDRVPRRDTWTRQSTDSLVGQLRSWSPKQVRTHFDGLRREGLITAARRRSNGAWIYQLPESLAAATNRFASLPRAD